MSSSSSGGFIHGILIGGGVVFFVAGIIIVAGIPGGILRPAAGGASDHTTTPVGTTEPTRTSTDPTSTPTTTETETTQPSTTSSSTPSTTTTTVSTTTTQTESTKTVLYRVNVGGRRLLAGDDGPAWLGDTEHGPTRYGNARVSGSHTNKTSDSIAMTAAVPAGTPEAVFQSRRYDADVADDPRDDTEMQYRFPVRGGTYEVRLYFVESYFDDSGWNDYQTEGPRKFDVTIEGKTVLHDYDMYRELGHDRGTTKTYTVKPKDGIVNVRFIHGLEDPMLSGIEIVRVENGKKGKNNDRDGDSEWSVTSPARPLVAVSKSAA